MGLKVVCMVTGQALMKIRIADDQINFIFHLRFFISFHRLRMQSDPKGTNPFS
jgi:hypothetical protein